MTVTNLEVKKQSEAMTMKAELLEKIQAVEPGTRGVLFLMLEEITNQSRLMIIGKSDFDELKGIVRNLAAAQGRTEQRMEELAQAQGRTEQRMEELAQAQARTEQRMDSLSLRMEELAQAEARTEQRMDSLSLRMEELAHAQARTERVVQKLSESVVDIRKQMGGLAMAVGYGIEDRLMPHIPKFAERIFGIQAGRVDRRNVIYPDGKYDEVNIYVEGEKDGHKTCLIGECKSQPGKRDFDRFAKLLSRIREHLDCNVAGMMIGYQYPPDVENYARTKYPSIPFFMTYEVERN
jgi:hypothetical protein